MKWNTQYRLSENIKHRKSKKETEAVTVKPNDRENETEMK